MMNAKKFKRISYLIFTTVLITVGIQVYRNVQNYQVNKERFMLDVQQSLDFAVENYYANRAKSDVLIFSSTNKISDVFGNDTMRWNTGSIKIISDTAKKTVKRFSNFNSYVGARAGMRDSLSSTFSFNMDGALDFDSLKDLQISNNIRVSVSDSVELKNMAKKIFLSLVNTSIEFEALDSFLIKELGRKSIAIDYLLTHVTRDSVFNSSNGQKAFKLVSNSKSTYLPDDQKLQISYENASMIILKRGLVDIFISILIISAVVGALYYLYKIIEEQKELAEIKNDLISNITHEFKTPIATISTAIEGISNFNRANDPEKTSKYLDISSGQLKKLNGMVEKLLETATLDSDELDLSLEPVETVAFTRQVFERFHLLKGDKKLSFQTSLTNEIKEIDAFHLENAISNLLDNALKYGGDEVQVSLEKNGEELIWTVADNGGQLEKAQQQRIFEKFYRVPTGNLHDVKGFGIGLYYAKKIAEIPGGAIDLEVSDGKTTFTLTI